MLKAAISFVSPLHSLSPTSESNEDHFFFPREYQIAKNVQACVFDEVFEFVAKTLIHSLLIKILLSPLTI